MASKEHNVFSGFYESVGSRNPGTLTQVYLSRGEDGTISVDRWTWWGPGPGWKRTLNPADTGGPTRRLPPAADQVAEAAAIFGIVRGRKHLVERPGWEKGDSKIDLGIVEKLEDIVLPASRVPAESEA